MPSSIKLRFCRPRQEPRWRPNSREAVLAYKAEAYAKRKAARDEMSALHQELGLE
jgi:hypothetical protein